MDSLSLKSYNSFQNKKKRKVTHFVAPRSLIFDKNNKFTRHEQVCLMRLRFRRDFPHDRANDGRSLLKLTLIKHTFSWREKFPLLGTLNRQIVFMYSKIFLLTLVWKQFFKRRKSNKSLSFNRKSVCLNIKSVLIGTI